ncbi:PP2C family protein-serine/threonine phosphatase [Streptomyces sp. WAC08241]|uniref:PP2C family protein-serine/threonine phosphatase n=1 Tax=Streptomyces sp. WAC08241 TaxID=2487421 RepID=UPI0021AEF9FF|nr:GAF domain-containing SpoIIE family protein phosphatase [Streptomyces sp. WAC08241]
MGRVEGATGVDPENWSAGLHRMWQAAQDAEDVTDMARHIYALMLAERAVVAVTGSRWDGRDLRYVRRLAADGAATAATTTPRPGSVRTVSSRPPAEDGEGAGGRAPVRLYEHDLTAADADFAPEAALLAEAGARWALEARFSLGGGDWASFSLGLSRRQDAGPSLPTRLLQVSEVLVAGNRRVLEHRAAERRRVEEAFLAEASLQMDATLDAPETLERIARLAVPAVAEACVVHLRRPGGGLSPVATVHVAAAVQPWLRGVAADDPWLDEALRAAAERPHGTLIAGESLEASVFGPHGEGPGRNVRAVSISPLRARGKLLGTLTFVYHRPEREIVDLRVLDDLAGRAALAIDTTTAYEQRRRNTEQLQRHLLPDALPDWPGAELTAAYEVADDSLEVGGDFYDAVVRRDGALALFVGDVCGRGAEAAALTGLARHTLRVLLEDKVPPGEALRRLNSVLTAQRQSARFVTAFVGVLVPDGDGYAVEAASAGHPRPLIRRADGRIDEVRASGLLLGVVPDALYEPGRAVLEPGDALVMFTDGLTEARSADGTMFESMLPEAVRECCRDGSGAAGLIARAAAFRALGDDDTAVLIARVTEERVEDAR